jgi:PHP family Zn ribbon phosphoesterase
MVLIFNNVWYPLNKVNEMTQKYIEVSKKYPPDESISKTIIIAVRAIKKGIEVIGIGDVVEGKFTEAINRTTLSNLEYASIDGFQYKLTYYMEISDAIKSILKMTPPEY